MSVETSRHLSPTNERERERELSSMSESDHIPPEVLEEIFLRLPVKSLVRFCSVCKLWYSLIAAPTFTSLYTRFTTIHDPNNNGNTMFIIRRYSKVQGREIFTLNYDDDSNKSLVQYRQLSFPFKSVLGCFEIVGSCYGLVCLTDTNFEETASCPKPIILWNPLVETSVTLPVKHSSNYSSACESIIGFGYDSSSNDYKVVRITRCFGDYRSRLGSIAVEIFGLSVGAWRSIMPVESPSYVITRNSPQAFLNGFIHWIGYEHLNEVSLGVGGKMVVAVFDVIKEAFGELEMPDEISTTYFNDGRSKTTVSILGKSLCLMRYYSEEQWRHHPCYELCHVWAMKEYGTTESWIKLYTVCPWGGFSKTLGLRRNGEILLITGYGEMVSYNPETQMISPLEIRGISGSFYLDIYTESLFLWKGNNGLLGKKSSSKRIAVS